MRRDCAILVAFLLTASCVSMNEPVPETGFLNRTMIVDGITYRYQVYVPEEYSRHRTWPVILFLHGRGESGSDGMLQTEVGLGPALRRGQQRPPAIIVFPQCPAESIWAGRMERVALATLEKTILEFRGDREQLYLTGMSMGAHGAWNLAANDPGHFAAIVAVCGWLQRPDADHLVGPEMQRALASSAPFDTVAGMIGKTPTWIFHGDRDTVVPVEQSRRMAAALRRAGAEVRYTEYAGVGHDSWLRAYAEPDLMSWLLSQRR